MTENNAGAMDHFMMMKVKNNHGFTILEIAAVLVVIGILIAVAVSRITATGNELYTERDLLKSNLRFVQFRALSNNTDAATTWGISFSGGSYKLQKNGADTTVYFPSDNDATHTLTGNVTVSIPSSVTYNYWGSPGTADITVTLNQGTQTTSFTITRSTGFIQ